VSFEAILSLLIICLHDMSVAVSVVLKPLTTIVLLSMSFFLLLIDVYIWVLPSWGHKYLQLLDLLVG